MYKHINIFICIFFFILCGYYYLRILPLQKEVAHLKQSQQQPVQSKIVAQPIIKISSQQLSAQFSHLIQQSDLQLQHYHVQHIDGQLRFQVELKGQFQHLIAFLQRCYASRFMIYKLNLQNHLLQGELMYSPNVQVTAFLLPNINPFDEQILFQRPRLQPQQFLLKDVSLQGLIATHAAQEAWLRLPDERLRAVHMGDCIARERACVISITAQGLKLKLRNQHIEELRLR